MFCSNCGKKVEDGAKFCAECGHTLGGNAQNRPNNGYVSSGMQFTQGIGTDKMFLGLIIVSVVLSALNAIIPLITAKLWSERRDLNVFELFDLNDLVDVLTGSKGFYGFLYILCIGSSILIAIAAIKLIYDVVQGENGSVLMDSANLASILCIVRFIVAFIIATSINSSFKKQGMDVQLLSVSVWTWIIAILAVLNLAVFKRLYLENTGTQTVQTEADAKNTSIFENNPYGLSKVCPVCKTSFSLGDVCPKCGNRLEK